MIPEKKLRGDEYFARLLKEYGVTHIFFQATILWRGTKKAAELGITSILAHTEAAAGYMADGYARITKRPGVGMAQSIGAANLAAGIQDAWLATSPVIAITGRKTGAFQYRNSYQDTEHFNFYADVTKFRARVTDPQQFPFLMRQCFREAVSGKPRPVHLDLYGHEGAETDTALMEEPFSAMPEFGIYPPFRFAADDDKIADAVKLLIDAKKPVIIAGRGAMISGAEQELREFAKKADIPVITTADGKSLLDYPDELWAGVLGGYGMFCANKVVSEADFVIFIGTQTSDQTTLDWSVPAPSIKGIQIDILSEELGRSYSNVLPVLGDARTVLSQLKLAAFEQRRPDWRKWVSELVADSLASLEDDMNSDETPINPARLCKELSVSLPDDAIVVSDTGYSAMWTLSLLRMKRSQTYLRSSGTLGWAYPASLGVKCGVPDRPVICFTGDGGFYYHLQEMETAARYGIKTITIINNNQMMAQCYHGGILPIYGEGKEGLGVLRNMPVEFSKLADNFGLRGIRVDKACDISNAIKEALIADTGVIIDVRTQQEACPPKRI